MHLRDAARRWRGGRADDRHILLQDRLLATMSAAASRRTGASRGNRSQRVPGLPGCCISYAAFLSSAAAMAATRPEDALRDFRARSLPRGQRVRDLRGRRPAAQRLPARCRGLAGRYRAARPVGLTWRRVVSGGGPPRPLARPPSRWTTWQHGSPPGSDVRQAASLSFSGAQYASSGERPASVE